MDSPVGLLVHGSSKVDGKDEAAEGSHGPGASAQKKSKNSLL